MQKRENEWEEVQDQEEWPAASESESEMGMERHSMGFNVCNFDGLVTWIPSTSGHTLILLMSSESCGRWTLQSLLSDLAGPHSWNKLNYNCYQLANEIPTCVRNPETCTSLCQSYAPVLLRIYQLMIKVK